MATKQVISSVLYSIPSLPGPTTFSGPMTNHRHGIIRDFIKLVMIAEGSDTDPGNTRRVWITINDIERDNWGIGGGTDWLRAYESSLDSIHSELKKLQRRD